MSNVELRPGGITPFPALLVGGAVVLLAAATIADRGVAPMAGLLVLVSVVAAGHRFALRWDGLVALLLFVVLVIPIKRYALSGSLPFDLEPYRITVAFLIGLWVVALLVDPRVGVRRSALDGPLMLFGLAVIGSVALNPDSITRLDVALQYVGVQSAENAFRDPNNLPYVDVSATVAKALLFLISLYLTYYFIVSVVRSPHSIHVVLKTLVGGTAGVAAFALIERRTGYNVFDHLQGWIPLISFEGGLDAEGIARGGNLRVYASAQHPIALAALFVMVIPLSLYLANHTKRLVWYGTTAVLLLAGLSTVSRTSVTMLVAVGIVFFVLKRSTMRRVAVLALPALIVIHIAIPGTIGGLRQAFFPSEGLVSDQTEFGGRVSSERIGPQLDIIRQQPAFGQGYGTRVTSGPDQNSRVLDNQWLATAVETGLVGVVAWAWLLFRFVRKAGGAAKKDLSDRGWLLTALTSSVVAFAVGMLTFDAFAFIQQLFIFFVLLAIGAAVLAWQDAWPEGANAKAPESA